jgi:FKBP-type peptidyl-prolyl cis-trans isomerase SlyD
MKIDDYRIVTVSYEVREGDAQGALLERMDTRYPFTFMFGVGQMLPGWEDRLRGLRVGTGFTFYLEPEQAYGRPRMDLIMDLPVELFRNEAEQIDPELLQVGQYITLSAADGKANNAKILSWNDKTVKVDANHALAGKKLFFAGAVLKVREATGDELVKKRSLEG